MHAQQRAWGMFWKQKRHRNCCCISMHHVRAGWPAAARITVCRHSATICSCATAPVLLWLLTLRQAKRLHASCTAHALAQCAYLRDVASSRLDCLIHTNCAYHITSRHPAGASSRLPCCAYMITFAAHTRQDYAAKLFDKEAALFCPSGTMTNQIAIKVSELIGWGSADKLQPLDISQEHHTPTPHRCHDMAIRAACCMPKYCSTCPSAVRLLQYCRTDHV